MYKSILLDSEFKSSLNDKEKVTRNNFIKMSFNKDNHTFVRIFATTMLNVFDKTNFYIEQKRILDIGDVYIIYTREIDAFMQFQIIGQTRYEPLWNLMQEYSFLLEIQSLHSYGKGQGKKLVEKAKEFSNELFIPIYLYDKNLKSENYYEELGFINTGYTNDEQDPILIYEPNYKPQKIKKTKKGRKSFIEVIKSVFKK